MAKELLQPSTCKFAEPKAKEYSLTDGENLYLRIRPSGHKSWVFIYSLRGKRQPKYTIATYPDMSLADARIEADRLRALVAKNIHPEEERKRLAAEQLAKEAEAKLGEVPKTVQALANRWIKDWCEKHHKDKGARVRRSLELHAMPYIGALELERLRAPHIVEVMLQLKNANKLRSAGVVFANIRQMCQYAVECGWMQGDPTAAMKKSTWAGPKKKRKRVLSQAEIVELATKLPKADLELEIICALWIMLSTTSRVGETGQAQIHEVSLDDHTWLIPATKQKKVNSGNVDHLVDLSPFAEQWFKRLVLLPVEREAVRAMKERRPEMPVTVDWLFPAAKRKGPINEKTIAHAVNDRQRFDKPRLKGRTPLIHSLELSGGKWTPHDLRRTGATLMRQLGTPADVVDRCQNHVETDEIRATYQHAELREEMKNGWAKLGSKLEELYKQGLEILAKEEDI